MATRIAPVAVLFLVCTVCAACGGRGGAGEPARSAARPDGAPPALAAPPGLVGGPVSLAAQADTAANRAMRDSVAAYEARRRPR
jgi:predicted small secreted protein